MIVFNYKSKKELKENVGNSLKFIETSLFGNEYVSNADAYDLGELYEMLKYASERGCLEPVHVQFTIERGH